jgi:hypothetical protein
MNHYISQLPQELQERLLYEIPSYGQLSTKITAGLQYYTNQLCYKDITINEFINYLNTNEYDQIYVYIDGVSQYIVLEMNRFFNQIDQTAYIFDYKEKLTINTFQYIDIYTYLYLPHVKITFDLITTANIYNKRQDCYELQNYLYNQIDYHFNYFADDEYDILVNRIKITFYIVSHLVTFFSTSSVNALSKFLNQNLQYVEFENGEYIGDEDELDELENYIARMMANQSKIINYVKTLSF